MVHALSLRQLNALRLALIFILFELLAVAAVVFLMMLPMAERASSDLTGLMVLSAQTWSELPPGTRSAFEQELLRAHGFALQATPPEDLAPLAHHYGVYLRVLAARLHERLGEPVTLFGSTHTDGVRIWVALPSGDQTLWLGLLDGRIGPHPMLALMLTLIGGLVLAVVAAWWLGGHILAPIQRLDEAAATLGRGETPTLLPEQGPRELMGLAHRFNQLSRQVRDLLEARTTLLAGLSHDLRTPLSRMRLALEMLQRRPDPVWIARLDKDIEEMDRLVGDVLTLARGLSREEAVKVSLPSLLEDAAEAARGLGADVRLHCPQKELVLPAASLHRVLANLLDNARRYAGEQPIELRAECGEAGCRIGILDLGPGIPEAELDAVFRPFHRVEQSRSPVTGGTGLGLAIVRQLAMAQGWRVWLENRPEGGLAAFLRIDAR